jgi:hypothetical protein
MAKGDPTHCGSDSSSDNGQDVCDAEANEAEVAVHRQRRRAWKASEEDFLRHYAEGKTWEEIGKELDRSPSGAAQHWRLMKQDVRGADRPAQLHRNRRRRRRRRGRTTSK